MRRLPPIANVRRFVQDCIFLSLLLASASAQNATPNEAGATASGTLSASPSFLSFLNQPVGTISNYQVVSLTANNGPVNIGSITPSNNSISLSARSCSNITLAAGTNCSFIVAFAANGPGTAVANIQIPTDTTTFNVPVSGNGITASGSTVTPETGWWWDSSLSGMGFFLELNAATRNIFMAGFFYDASGTATWLVSTGNLSGSAYTGQWLRCTGSQSFLTTWQNTPTCNPSGTIGLTFADSQHATLTRPDGTKINLTRFVFGGGSPQTGSPQNGWWWDAAASGTGYGIEMQGKQVFIVGYTYDNSTPSNPIWYLALGDMTTSNTYSGTWQQYGNGPQLTSPECGTSCGSAKVVNANAGSMTLNFTSPTSATLTNNGVAIPLTNFEQNPPTASGVSVLNTAVTGTGSGAVSVSPVGDSCGLNCYLYSSNVTVTVTATPTSPSTFAGWAGSCSGTSPCKLTMTSSRVAIANFSSSGIVTYNLSTSTAGNGAGTISVNPAGVSCGTNCYTYNAGTPVTLSATAAAGSTFAGWTGGCAGTGTCTVTMNANTAVTANFVQTTGGISVSVSPSSASLSSGGQQQFTALVTGTTNTGVTWSVNGVNGGTASTGTISASGLYLAPSAVTSTFSATITATSAADGTKSGSATVTVTSVTIFGPAINSVSNGSPMPLSLLQLNVSGVDTSATAAPVTLTFSNGAGFTRTKTALSMSAGTVLTGVPLYINPSLNQIAQGTVSLTISQNGKTSAPVSITIQNVPPTSTYGTQPGQISNAFLIMETMLHASRLNQLQALQLVVGSSINTQPGRTTLGGLEHDAILARDDVQHVALNASATYSWGTLPDGTRLQFDRTQLDMMDRMLALYLTQTFTVPKTAGGMQPLDIRTGKPDPKLAMSSILKCILARKCIEASVDEATNTTDPKDIRDSIVDNYKEALEDNGSERLSGVVGLTNAFLHLSATMDSYMNQLGKAFTCAGDPDCTGAEGQAIANEMQKDALEFAAHVADAVSNVPLLLEMKAEAKIAGNLSQGFEALVDMYGKLSGTEMKEAANEDVELTTPQELSSLAGRLGVVTGTATESTTASIPPESSLDLCCFGTAQDGIVATADPSGDYEMFVPLGVPGTSYNNLYMSLIDYESCYEASFYCSSLSYQGVSLGSLNSTTPITIPPMTGYCNDSDADTPDNDDPDCDGVQLIKFDQLLGLSHARQHVSIRGVRH